MYIIRVTCTLYVQSYNNDRHHMINHYMPCTIIQSLYDMYIIMCHHLLTFTIIYNDVPYMNHCFLTGTIIYMGVCVHHMSQHYMKCRIIWNDDHHMSHHFVTCKITYIDVHQMSHHSLVCKVIQNDVHHMNHRFVTCTIIFDDVNHMCQNKIY